MRRCKSPSVKHASFLPTNFIVRHRSFVDGVGCHAFAAGLQLEQPLSDHGESMRSLQGLHAFAVVPHDVLLRTRPAKAWHPARFHLLPINKRKQAYFSSILRNCASSSFLF